MSRQTAPEIRTIAVLGAGTMGRGIAQVAAGGGYETCLFDIAGDALERARDTVDRNLDKGVELRKLDPDVMTPLEALQALAELKKKLD